MDPPGSEPVWTNAGILDLPPPGGKPTHGRDVRCRRRVELQPDIHIHTTMLTLPFHNRYGYSAIESRKDYAWPGGKRQNVRVFVHSRL